MDLESSQNNAFAKLPLLKQDGTSTSTIPGLVTTEEKAQKKNDVKARSILLMALLNEHLLTFSQYKDAKTLFEAIQARFSGNDSIKKTQRTLLKQMYENFNAPSTESLDSIFNRLQKIISQLAILDENISQEDLNMKFLRSINEVDTASIQVSVVSTLVSTVSSHDNTTNLSDATVYAFLANQPNGSQLVHEDLEQIHKDDLEEMDLKWQLALLSMRAKRSPRNQESRPRNQDSSRKTVIVEDTSSKAMMAIDGAGFDWTYMADDEVSTNMALMAFSDSEMVQKLMLKNVEKRTVQKEVRPVWNNAMRTNHQNFSNSRRNFAPTAILTKSGIVPISTARQSSSRAASPVSATRPINTVASKPLNNNVNTAKANSVNTAKGNKVTSAVGNKRTNAVKSLACWVWRPKIKVQDHVSKNSGSYICKRFDYVDPEGRLNAKTTSWNEFNSTMASAIIYLATNQKFNFSRFVQLIINHQLGDMTHQKDIFDTPSLTKKVSANMKREVDVLQADTQPIPIPTEPLTSKPQKKHKPKRKQTQEPEVPPTKSQPNYNVPLPSPSHDLLPSGKDSLKLKELMDLCTNLSNKVLDLESEVLNIKSTYKAKFEKLESRVKRLEEENRLLKELKGVHSIVDSDEPVMENEESSKQGRKIADINADVEINLEKVQAETYNLDLNNQEKVLSMLDVNDEEPAGVEEVLEVVTAAKLITEVVTTAGVDVNAAVNEGIKVPEKEVRQEKEVKVESSKRESESLKQEIAKKQKIEQETKELKKHLQIVPDDDDDVYADATPLALKILIVDYKIHTERNRPYFKINRADGNHRLFMSFSTMMKNFDREDLESLWKIITERFEKTEPKNYTDDVSLEKSNKNVNGLHPTSQSQFSICNRLNGVIGLG
uniref:Uncharacterized protein n=1 Tax=Tanacetum cinerariifolium TaxID=118510 RepID=A0A6L2KT50_TANCI|nr:hypothetical protein [Tanacetum cinerariifolium]